MTQTQQIIIEDTLMNAGSVRLADYVCHALCYKGHCTFEFNGRHYRLEAGQSLIVRRGDMMLGLEQSRDFRADVIYVTPEFIAISTPQSNYGTKGALSLFNNPILRLTPEQQQVCALDFDYIKRRLALTTHRFHRDAMINAIQCMIIDFFDFHAQLHGDDKISTLYAQTMERFIALLERGDNRQHRDIGHYADILCVTPKYLSEVSKKVSGFAANYWITRYATLDISRLLRDKQMSFADITELYGFSSVSYFSRYVQKYLGVAPSELRK